MHEKERCFLEPKKDDEGRDPGQCGERRDNSDGRGELSQDEKETGLLPKSENPEIGNVSSVHRNQNKQPPNALSEETRARRDAEREGRHRRKNGPSYTMKKAGERTQKQAVYDGLDPLEVFDDNLTGNICGMRVS